MLNELPSSASTESWILIQDRAAAGRLRHWLLEAELIRWTDPREVAPGWWLCKVDLPPDDDAVLEILAGAPAALVVQGEAADIGRIILYEKDRSRVELLWGADLDGLVGIPRAEESAAFIQWTSEHAPKPLSIGSANRLWHQLATASGREMAHALISGLGWSIPDEASVDLGGCVSIVGLGQPQFIGERLMDWVTVRWAVGRGKDFFGLWDRDHPDGPVRRWPLTGEGRSAAREAQRRLVDVPIIASTLLNGERAWTTYTRRGGPPIRFIIHFAPELYASLFIAKQPPFTRTVTEQGLARIPAEGARTLGLPLPRPGIVVDYPIRSLLDAQTVVRAMFHAGVMGDWHGVPDEVHRGLAETVDWTIRQRGNEA